MMIKRLITVGVFLIAIFFLWKYVKRKEAKEITQEKVVTTATEAHIKGFDPIQGEDMYSIREMAKVYEGLLDYEYLKRPFELMPNLAESMPTVSDDQLVYTFKIKEGVQFHDNPCFPQGKGRELTAHDFVYSFKRLADPRNQAKGFWLVDDKIKGLNEWRKKHAEAATVDYSEGIPGIQATDKYTLQFTLTKPYPQFLYTLALVPTFVVPHEAVEHYGAEFVNHPVGTGPFTTEAFNPQDTKIVYHKNPTFRDKYFPSDASDEYKYMLGYAGKKLPFVDKVITYILPEEQPRWLKFQKGQLDVADISKDNVALEVIHDNALKPELEQKGIQLFKAGEASTRYIVINNSHDLFKKNLKLRQAMSLAFDGETFNKLFHNNTAILAQSTIPPGLAGYQPDYVNPYRKYNLQKAKQYLAEAGYPGGKGLPKITLDLRSSTDDKQRGEFFQKCMKDIGINIEIVSNIFPELIKKISNKSTMLHAIAWSGDYPDGETFLRLFYGADASAGIGAYMNDPAFNALFEKASVLPDSPERTMLYERLNRMVAENIPCIYLAHLRHLVLHHGWLKNYNWSDFHYGTEQYWDVDLEQKKTLSTKL